MQFLAWGGFLLLIAIFLALDLGVFHKSNEAPSTKSALRWTAVWVSVALAFNVAIYFIYENHFLGIGAPSPTHVALDGSKAAQYFFTGYLVELSLSLDNIFVIALIFRFFKIPGDVQHRVLFWGILGAVVLRILMILVGAALIASFSWSIQIFGAFLVYTAAKMALSKGDDDFDPEHSSIVKLARRYLPFSTKMDGDRFRTTENGKRLFTPLFLVLVVVEGSDVVFAVDSIPAVFGVFDANDYADPFIVFTSNIFAILGLRSLYFALASLLRQFAYLKYSLIIVLGFVGMKMLVARWFHPPSWISLGVIVLTLVGGVVLSLLLKQDEDEEEDADPQSIAAPSPLEQGEEKAAVVEDAQKESKGTGKGKGKGKGKTKGEGESKTKGESESESETKGNGKASPDKSEKIEEA